MSDFELEKLRRQRVGLSVSPPKPQHVRKAGQFHWDRAAYYKHSLSPKTAESWGSAISGRTDSSDWAGASWADQRGIARQRSDWVYEAEPNLPLGSRSEIMENEDPKCRAARMLALARTRERMEAKRQESVDLLAQGPADPTCDSEAAVQRRERWQREVAFRAQLRGEDKAMLQLVEIEQQEEEIRRNEELIRQLENGEIEPNMAVKSEWEDDRNPKTNPARNEVLKQLKQTVAERREAERRALTIQRQREILRQQKSLIKRLERGDVEFTSLPCARPPPDPKEVAKKQLAADRAKGRAASAGPRRERSRTQTFSLSSASRRGSGLDVRAADAIASHAQNQMRALLSPKLRENFAPLTSERSIKPLMTKLSELEKAVAAKPTSQEARRELVTMSMRARALLNSVLVDRMAAVGSDMHVHSVVRSSKSVRHLSRTLRPFGAPCRRGKMPTDILSRSVHCNRQSSMPTSNKLRMRRSSIVMRRA